MAAKLWVLFAEEILIMAKYKQEEAVRGEWSCWINPVMKGYKLACCDCGLVHDFDFRTFKVVKRTKSGKSVKLLPVGKFQLEFRCRRNKRSTAMVRRHKK